MGDGEWTEMLWETHAFTKAIPFYGDGTNSKPNKPCSLENTRFTRGFDAQHEPLRTLEASSKVLLAMVGDAIAI